MQKTQIKILISSKFAIFGEKNLLFVAPSSSLGVPGTWQYFSSCEPFAILRAGQLPDWWLSSVAWVRAGQLLVWGLTEGWKTARLMADGELDKVPTVGLLNIAEYELGRVMAEQAVKKLMIKAKQNAG